MDQPDPLKGFSAADVLKHLHGFQRDAVEHAHFRLFEASDSTRRFLIADEVGLGKTLIAKGVLAKMLDHLKDRVDRIDVVYVCSNLSIAAQNINRLNPIRNYKFSKADRITLLPIHLKDLDTQRVNFVAFTPGTSLNMGNSLGTSRERRLLYTLLVDHWNLSGVRALNVLQGNVQDADRFRERTEEFIGKHTISPTLRSAFYERLAKRPELQSEFVAVCDRFPRQKTRVPEEDRKARNVIIGKLRAALASTCIGELEPDLIILDEFQRFKALLEPDSEEGELARQLFDWTDADGTAAAHVLLLSATPYKAYTLQHEIAEDDHYEDFLRTVAFLDKNEKATNNLKALLEQHRRALLRIGSGSSDELLQIKKSIEEHLRRIMSRTERLSAGQIANGMIKPLVSEKVLVSASDLKCYPSMRALTDELDVDDVVDYWKSAAYPLNFMEGYQLRKSLQDRMADGIRKSELFEAITRSKPARIPITDVREYRMLDPLPNARLRELVRQLSDDGAFELLWLPPGLPYYKLSGPYAKADNLTKRLVFSAWHLVPRSIASLVTYECERRAFNLDEKEPKNTAEARRNRRGLLRFSESEGRLTGMPVLGLLYPSSALAKLCDPREFVRESKAANPDPQLVLEWATNRVRASLPASIKYATEGQSADENWYWAAPILLDMRKELIPVANWWREKDLASRWSGGAIDDEAEGETDKGWNNHVLKAAELVRDDEWPTGLAPSDLPVVLALIGLAGPATSALRALERLFPEEADSASLAIRDAAASIAWAFRSLFNRPEAMALIRRGRRDPYWKLLLEHAHQGCLSSVIAEYLHVLRDSTGNTLSDAATACPELAAAAASALQIRAASLEIDEFHADESTKEIRLTKESMRSLFAMRFGSDKSEDEEQVRRDSTVSAAFNSPFWPFVLATTSVGQEGLDFHWYCHAVVHWNLPSNPVDLEQREGRVHRFKGHAVRKNVAASYGLEALTSKAADPWTEVFNLAKRDAPPSDRGLVPYWLYTTPNGALIERHVLAYPLSRDEVRYQALQRSLGAYRMVFGQPRQDELLAYLLSRVDSAKLEEWSKLLMMDIAPPRHAT